MSIVIMVGGDSINGNYEHRYLVNAFLEKFDSRVTRIISAEPVRRSLPLKIKRTLKRGNYLERLRRASYGKGYGPEAAALGKALFGSQLLETMPGGNRRVVVPDHNSPDCEQILDDDKPSVLVVYGTRIIRSNIIDRAGVTNLNMHTGLSPYYRGDSTMFWPIYYNDPGHIGVTVHKLVTEIDGGDIVHTGKVGYEPGDTEADIFARGVKLGTRLYLDAVQAALDGTIEYHRQDLSIGREFSWTDRTVAAEKKVLETLDEWKRAA